MTETYTLDYDKLDPGIRKVVRWLRRHGYDTCDSGDGSSKPPEHRWHWFPHVFITVDASVMIYECDRLVSLLVERGIHVQPCGPEDGMAPEVGGTYDPAHRSATIHLFNVSDDMLDWEPPAEGASNDAR